MTENIRYLNRIHQLSESDMRDFIVLHRMLEVEMSKSPEEMDLKLIDECSAQIDELAGEGPKHSSAMIQAKIKQILGEPTSRVSRNRAKVKAITTVDMKNRHRVRKFFVILAASLLLLYSSLTVAAKMQGYSNAWEFIAQKFNEIFNLDSSKSLEEGSFNFIMEDERVEYDSVETLLREENLDILYPDYLPKNTSLKSVQKYNTTEDKFKITFTFNDASFSLMVKNYHTYDHSATEGQEEIQTNSCLFKLVQLENGCFQATCQHEGYEYTITHANHTELLNIVNSMKGHIS